MANYSVLKAAVQAVVKTNGNQEITGANMQSTLISIINSLGTGYQFMGVATPSTSPGTPDYNVAYIGGAGTYANFGTSVTVPVGSVCVFKYNGSWTKEQIALFAGIDDEPTLNSDKLVKSDGIYNDIASQNGIHTFNDMYAIEGAVGTSSYTSSTDVYRNTHIVIRVNGGEALSVTANSSYSFIFAVLKTYSTTGNFDFSSTSPFNARILVEAGNSNTYTLPQDARFIIFTESMWNENHLPVALKIDDYDFSKDINQNLLIINNKIEEKASQLDVDNLASELDNMDEQINGGIEEIDVVCAYTFAGYIDSNGRRQGYSNLGLAYFLVESGKTYRIDIEKATNSAGYILSFAPSIDSNPVQPITDAGMGTSAPFTYTYTATGFGYLIVGYYGGTTLPTVKELRETDGIADIVEDLDEQINGHAIWNEIQIYTTEADKYCDTSTNRVQTYTGNNLSLAKFPIVRGKVYRVSCGKTTNSAGYVLSYADTATSINITPVINQVGNRGEFTYTFTSIITGYLFVGISTDTTYTTLEEQGQSDCIVTDIEQLKRETAGIDWSGKKWFVIGDSLSTINSATTKRYIDYISELTGISVSVRAVGGSSWGQPQLEDNAFFQQAEDTPSDADVVTIFGSFNSWYKMNGGVITDGPTSPGDIDSEDVTTRYGCINKVFINIFANAPLAQVGVIYPTPWQTSNPYNGSTTADSLITMLDNATQRWGIAKLDLYHESGMRPWNEDYRNLVYSKDTGGIDENPAGVHPNEIGHAFIATRVLQFMKSLINPQMNWESQNNNSN